MLYKLSGFSENTAEPATRHPTRKSAGNQPKEANDQIIHHSSLCRERLSQTFHLASGSHVDGPPQAQRDKKPDTLPAEGGSGLPIQIHFGNRYLTYAHPDNPERIGLIRSKNQPLHNLRTIQCNGLMVENDNSGLVLKETVSDPSEIGDTDLILNE